MAARTRASFTDDDSISDHLALEMVRINAPQTTSSTIHIDPDEQTALDESIGGSGIPVNDFLTTSNPGLIEGINRECEIPDLFTYKKVIKISIVFFFINKFLNRLNHYLKECKMKIQVYQ